MDTILGLYDSIEATEVGAILYIPLSFVFFFVGDYMFRVIWTFIVFSLAILFSYRVLRLLADTVSRVRSA